MFLFLFFLHVIVIDPGLFLIIIIWGSSFSNVIKSSVTFSWILPLNHSKKLKHLPWFLSISSSGDGAKVVCGRRHKNQWLQLTEPWPRGQQEMDRIQKLVWMAKQGSCWDAESDGKDILVYLLITMWGAIGERMCLIKSYNLWMCNHRLPLKKKQLLNKAKFFCYHQ